MKKKMHFTIMGLVVAVLALALALTGCAKDASGNTNASTSESVDVNADMRDQESRETLVLEGTVWRAETVSTSDGTTYTWSEIISSGMQEKGTEFILEFIDDKTCVELTIHWGRVSAISEYTYKIAGDKLVIRGGDYTDSSYENGTIVLTTSSNDKFQYKITNYPIIKPEMDYVSEEAAQEAELRYNAEDSTDSNTESETYVYTLNGREIMLHIKLEDYIQDGVISFGELIQDLGYSSAGYVYDEDDNPVAQIGRFVYLDDTVPCHMIETFINIPYIYEDSGHDEEHILIYDEHGNSGVLTINGYGSRPIHISYNQLIAATYIWETYSDGKIHENPLRDVFGDDGVIREHNYFVS